MVVGSSSQSRATTAAGSSTGFRTVTAGSSTGGRKLGSLNLTSSAPSLSSTQTLSRPSTTNTIPKHLYEVSTGLVPIRGGPSKSCSSKGIMRGGHRFYGTEYQVGKNSWLKLQTEDLPPPLYSPKTHKQRRGSTGSDRHYKAAVPELFVTPEEEDEEDEDCWVKKDLSCLVQIRAARGNVKTNKRGTVWSDKAAASLLVPKHLNTPLAAFPDALSSTSASMSSISSEAWASCGGGAWCNFGRFASRAQTADSNCGRFRQLGDDHFGAQLPPPSQGTAAPASNAASRLGTAMPGSRLGTAANGSRLRSPSPKSRVV